MVILHNQGANLSTFGRLLQFFEGDRLCGLQRIPMKPVRHGSRRTTQQGWQIGELELFLQGLAERPDHVTSMTSFAVPHTCYF